MSLKVPRALPDGPIGQQEVGSGGSTYSGPQRDKAAGDLPGAVKRGGGRRGLRGKKVTSCMNGG